jgi:hypothetical protein
MKDLIIPANNEALSRALVAIVGQEQTEAVLKAYQVIDQAMVFGYQRGLKVAEEQSKMEYVKHLGLRWQEGFDAGFVDGKHCAALSEQDSFDEGYVDGVQDARMDPETADTYLDHLCAMDSYADNNTTLDADEFTGDDHLFANYGDDELTGVEHFFPDYGDDEFAGLQAKINAHPEGESWDQYFDDGGPYNDEHTYVDDVDSGDEQPIAADTF